MANAQPPAPEMPQLSPKMLVAPVTLMLIKFTKVELTDYLFELRIAYAFAVLLNLSSLAACYLKARGAAKADEAKSVKVEDKQLDGTTKTRMLAATEYDMEQAFSKIKQASFQVAIAGAIHYKWQSPMPLLFQSLMLPMGIIEEPCFKIYFLGNTTIKRPFAAPPNPMADLLGGAAGGAAAGAAAAPAVEAAADGDAKSVRGKKAKVEVKKTK